MRTETSNDERYEEPRSRFQHLEEMEESRKSEEYDEYDCGDQRGAIMIKLEILEASLRLSALLLVGHGGICVKGEQADGVVVYLDIAGARGQDALAHPRL
jgi:hypothetical protein